MRRPPLLLALALVLAALAGCGSGDEAPEPPPGFARYEDEGFSLAYPRGWKPREKDKDEIRGFADRAVEFDAPEALSDTEVRPELTVSAFQLEDEQESAKVLDFHKGEREDLFMYELASEREVELSQAATARLYDWRFTSERPDGSQAEVRQLDLVVLDEDLRTGYNILATGPPERIDELNLRAALDSFRLR